MDDLACPRCRTTKYRNPSLRLKINSCGHALCEACVEIVFLRESAACPECGKNIKKKDFRIQLFEDTRVEKEVDIRKSVLKIYNKLPEDFSDLRSYNDYLEHVEDIIWSLENEKDTKAIREQIQEYKQENEQLIRKNSIKLSKEREKMADAIARSVSERESKSLFYKRVDMSRDAEHRQANEDLLTQLTDGSYYTPEELLEMRNQQMKVAYGDVGAHYEADGSGDARMAQQDVNQLPDQPYRYEPLLADTQGPYAPRDEQQLKRVGYLDHVMACSPVAMSGGYSSEMACARALADAFVGLFHAPQALATALL